MRKFGLAFGIQHRQYLSLLPGAGYENWHTAHEP
jgi:hypothetical protein